MSANLTSTVCPNLDKETLLEQFNEFFSIQSQFNVNVTPLEQGELIDYQRFSDDMPLPFKIAGEINTLEQSALKPLQSVAGVAEQLTHFLQLQNQKIDLLVSYVVSQQDQAENRYSGMQLGGGGIIFTAETAFDQQQVLEVKIFLNNQKTAIYCHGVIADIEKSQQGYAHKIVFRHIREQDRESLVRTSLHLQSKQLKELSAARNQTS